MEKLKELVNSLKLRVPKIEAVLVLTENGNKAYFLSENKKAQILGDIEKALTGFAESVLEKIDGGAPEEVIIKGRKKLIYILTTHDFPSVAVLSSNSVNLGLLKLEVKKLLENLKGEDFNEEKVFNQYINAIGEDELERFLEEFKLEEEESEGAQ